MEKSFWVSFDFKITSPGTSSNIFHLTSKDNKKLDLVSVSIYSKDTLEVKFTKNGKSTTVRSKKGEEIPLLEWVNIRIEQTLRLSDDNFDIIIYRNGEIFHQDINTAAEEYQNVIAYASRYGFSILIY